MMPPKRSSRTKPPLRPPPERDGVARLKVWLLGISPMIWRRLLVPSTCTLRELHGVIQVAMGREGIHLYQFCPSAAHYGSCELSASSPEVTLAALRLRKGARFTYEYDLNIPWRHEVRIKDHCRRSRARPIRAASGPRDLPAGRPGPARRHVCLDIGKTALFSASARS
jgi:hypothetical protein